MPVVGQTGNKDLVAYSPWIPRPSDATAAVFVGYLIDKGGSGTLDVQVYHRNLEDTDTGSLVGAITASPMSTVNKIEAKEYTGLKEMLRYKYTVAGSSASDWVHWAMPRPIFYEKKT